MSRLFLFFYVVLFGTSFGTCACENKTLPGSLIDGDIMIQKADDLWDRHHGPLVDMQEIRWPTGIVPFDLDDTAYSEWDLFVIKEALKVIESSTCVKFVRRSDEKDYVYITPLGGCWSYVGRQGSEQFLSLVVPQCINKGTIIHEFMHALGFWHEHSRSDRDEYIDVLWDNVIDKEKQANFIKILPESLNIVNFPYDYQSVMHYDAFVFSKSSKLPTMRPKDPNMRLRNLGLALAVGTLTESDKNKINSLYECKGH